MNNMYDILGKMNSLTPQEKPAEAAKPIYESVEARGSIVAGIKDVEQKLREQYEATKEERETLKTKSGTIYKGGTYGTEYDVGDDGSKKPKAKHVPKKGVKGRPKKEQPAKVDAPKGDIFGRTTGAVPKGKKGTVVKGKAMSHDVNNAKDEELDEVANPFAIGMAQAKKEVGLGRAKTHVSKKVEKRGHEIGKAIKKGMNESRDHESSDYTYETVGRRLAAENPNMDTNSDAFFDAVYDECIEIGLTPKAARNLLNYNEDFLSDTASAYAHFARAVESRGPSFAPQHPGTPAPVAKPSFLDKAKAFGQKALNTMGHGSDDELRQDLARKAGVGTPPNRYNEDAELNELAKLAGLQVAEAAKPDFTDVDNDKNEKESWKKAEKDKAEDEDKEKVDECMSPMGSMAQEMQQSEQQKGRMSVNTSADSEGHKTVTITADGEEAEKLAQLLSLAGISGHPSQQPQEQAAIVVAQEAKEYGDTDVEEAPELANSPKEQVASVDQSPTTGLAGGTDDLNKPKEQDPKTANKAANPKAEKQLEDVNPLDSLGAKLMAEYQSIKISK